MGGLIFFGTIAVALVVMFGGGMLASAMMETHGPAAGLAVFGGAFLGGVGVAVVGGDLFWRYG